MKTAIYPLSADPLTNGHLDIIKRASKVFNKLIVAIGNNFSKDYLFEIKEREEITKKVLQNYKNLEILSFNCLLTDLAKQKNVNYIVRGFRNSNDYLHELSLYQNYLSQNSNLEFINLFSNKEFISSSAIKEIASLHGDIHTQAPLLSKFKLEQKLHQQKIITVTGLMGGGKSFFIENLKKSAKEKQVHSIDFDKLGHRVLANPILKTELDLKLKLPEKFKKLHQTEYRKELAKQVFSSENKLKQLENFLLPWILLELRKELKNKKGLILLEIPLLIEKNLPYLSNNQVVLIQTEKDFRYQNLLRKGLNIEDIKAREKHQLDFKTKEIKLQKQIKADNFGKILKIRNSQQGFEPSLDIEWLDNYFRGDIR